MQASDPKPGRHLVAILVASAWASDDNPKDVEADFIGSPPDGMLALVGAIKRMPSPEAS